MAFATWIDVLEVCGADQLCAGTKAGIEASMHIMKELFEADDTEGLLLVDAANTLNTLKRPTAQWNCCIPWPRCSVFVFNRYCGYATIILRAPAVGVSTTKQS